VPVPDALETIFAGAERIVEVPDAEIEAAMRHYFTDTHNVVEGAGAAPLAAALQERGQWRGKRVGLIASGGNIDLSLYRRILGG
jgi:threonine dehydratase